MEQLRVGFIGLGIMGSAMAMNIHKKGFRSLSTIEQGVRQNPSQNSGYQWLTPPGRLRRRVMSLLTW